MGKTTEAPDPRVEREAVYTPNKGESLLIRGTMSGRTTQWAFQMTHAGIWVPGLAFGLQLTGRITGASFAGGIDDRIAQQRRSIDTMLDHLKVHCPKLLGTGDCEHIGKAEVGT